MEYNKTKRGLELGASLTALIYCAIDLVLEIVAFFQLLEVIAELKSIYGEAYSDMDGVFAKLIIVMIIGVALVVIELLLACKLLKTPKQTENGFENKKGVRITFIVFSSILTFFFFIGILAGITEESAAILGLLIFTTVIVLESVAMSMKDVKERSDKKEVAITTNLGVEQKIAELKHLKELGVIDEEQYKNVVEKNIKEIL